MSVEALHGSVPLSAMIGSHDEAHLLRASLPSALFCDDVIVIDIASDDDTAAVARSLGARVIAHRWVPIAERARIDLLDEARHDWLLFLDPDEVIPPALAGQIAELVPTLEDDVAVVVCPWQFFFRGKPLRGTVWGGVGKKRMIAHRERARIRPTVHSGTGPGEGYRTVEIPYSGDNAIAHYWSNGWHDLLEKHVRYLRLEGPDRYRNGMITGYRDIAATPLASFVESFVQRRGYRDGPTGFALSLVWAAYSTLAKVALLRELRRRGGLPEPT